MDSYKITYFNLRGIVEPIRLLFKYVNVPFEDDQVEATSWTDIKKDFKWQQLPIFEYNGKRLTQSGAIGNFLAAKFDLPPEDPWDKAKCEEIIGAAHDLRLRVRPYFEAKFGGNLEHSNELRQELLETTAPLFLTNLHELLEEIRENSSPENGNDNDNRTDLILGGDKPTWADFNLAHYTDQWTTVLEDPNLLDKFSLLKKQQDAVYDLPGVAQWIAERPDTFI